MKGIESFTEENILVFLLFPQNTSVMEDQNEDESPKKNTLWQVGLIQISLYLILFLIIYTVTVETFSLMLVLFSILLNKEQL